MSIQSSWSVRILQSRRAFNCREGLRRRDGGDRFVFCECDGRCRGWTSEKKSRVDHATKHDVACEKNQRAILLHSDSGRRAFFGPRQIDCSRLSIAFNADLRRHIGHKSDSLWPQSVGAVSNLPKSASTLAPSSSLSLLLSEA